MNRHIFVGWHLTCMNPGRTRRSFQDRTSTGTGAGRFEAAKRYALQKEVVVKSSNVILRVAAVAAIAGGVVWPVHADTLTLRSGDFYQGIIQEVDDGEVRMEVNREVVVFDILDVASMNFDTPHLLASGADPAMEHFLSDLESQEVVETFAQMDQAARELEMLVTQVRMYWEAREPIESREAQAWEAARDRFRRPLGRYQELLNDLYFHVLARVDEYNQIAAEADDIYVGVRGIFNVGSPLLPDGMGQLSLRRYVPAGWYDTIYYEG
jgi:hypothetical protein